MSLKVFRRSPTAKIPIRGTPGSAGLDLFSDEKCTIEPKGKHLVTTGIIVEIPDDSYGRIAPRSSLAFNHFIAVGAGVIDRDYRGVVRILLFNHGRQPFEIEKGDKIAQLICEKIISPIVEEIRDVSHLSSTLRGASGFGSTGK